MKQANSFSLVVMSKKVGAGETESGVDVRGVGIKSCFEIYIRYVWAEMDAICGQIHRFHL